MDEHSGQFDWNRVAADWPQIGELVQNCRDRAQALRRLVTEMNFDAAAADKILSLRVGDLVQFARPAPQASQSKAHGEWQSRGLAFTPNEFRREDREPWSQWIRDGVENNWLNVIRLNESGVLTALSRTNDDRTIYVEHPTSAADAIRVHTSIGGTYGFGDELLHSEVAERIYRANDWVSDDSLLEGLWQSPFSGCVVALDGTETAARVLISNGWWAVAVSIDPITSAYITGHGDEIPQLDLVTVKSFGELEDQTAKR